jgi:hypothetical protein
VCLFVGSSVGTGGTILIGTVTGGFVDSSALFAGEERNDQVLNIEWPTNVLILTWFVSCLSLLGVSKETLQARPHFGGVQPICPCTELANSTFDDGIPRLVNELEVFLGTTEGEWYRARLPVEFCYELSVDRFLG